MQRDHIPGGDGLSDRTLRNAAADNDDGNAAMDEADATADDTEFSDEHPLASPGELAGTAGQAIAAEIAALGPVDGSLADAADGPADANAGVTTTGDAIGSAAEMDVGSGTPPDRSGAGGGEPLDQQGSRAPSAARSPGGDNRA